MYGIQIWSSASNSSILIVQSVVLQSISNAPWLLTNKEIHGYPDMNTYNDEIHNVTAKYQKKLEKHPNKLAAELTMRNNDKLLTREDILYLR